MKVYAIEIMGNKEPTHVGVEDVAKLAQATNAGIKLVYVGGDLISPSSVSRVRRLWNADPEVINEGDDELEKLLTTAPKRLD